VRKSTNDRNDAEFLEFVLISVNELVTGKPVFKGHCLVVSFFSNEMAVIDCVRLDHLGRVGDFQRCLY
jgi:hypothetical protein